MRTMREISLCAAPDKWYVLLCVVDVHGAPSTSETGFIAQLRWRPIRWRLLTLIFSILRQPHTSIIQSKHLKKGIVCSTRIYMYTYMGLGSSCLIHPHASADGAA